MLFSIGQKVSTHLIMEVSSLGFILLVISILEMLSKGSFYEWKKGNGLCMKVPVIDVRSTLSNIYKEEIH